MKRYFFDVVGQKRTQYDFCGCEFATPEDAFRLAELIALDLAVSSEDAWSGWSIKVRSPEAQEFFSIPVQSSCLATA